jgi:hypothetical protein
MAGIVELSRGLSLLTGDGSLEFYKNVGISTHLECY